MAQITVTMKLKPAAKHDLYDRQTGYRYGTVYFVRSGITGEFDKFPYYLTKDTDLQELSQYFKFKQIFVPVRLFDECDIEIHELEKTESA